MSDDANVGSIDAVREFRASLATFLQESRDALITYDLEARRALEWLLETQPKFWQQELRKTQEKVTELNIAFQACRAQKLPGGGQPACLEEKKALDKAKARLVYVQDKIVRTRKWGLSAERQAIEYKGRSTQLMSVLDGEVPNALALMDRVLSSLEAYIGQNHPGARRTTEEVGSQAESVAKPLADEKAAGEQQAEPGQPPGSAGEGPAAEGSASEGPAEAASGVASAPAAAENAPSGA